MDRRQVFGIFGSLLLFVGVFTPIISLPIVGAQNYFQNGSGDGTYVLVFAGIGLVLSLIRRYRLLLIPALLSIALLAYAFVNIQSRISEIHAKMSSDLANNPFRGLGEALAQSVQLQWGWAVLGAGALLLLIAGISPDPQQTAAAAPASSAAAAAVVAVVVLGGVAFFGYSQVQRWETGQRVAAEQGAAEQKAREQREREEHEKADAVYQLHLQKFDWKAGEYSTYLVGSVRNDSPRRFRFVHIEFSLLDRHQDLVGTASDSVSSLEPGENLALQGGRVQRRFCS